MKSSSKKNQMMTLNTRLDSWASTQVLGRCTAQCYDLEIGGGAGGGHRSNKQRPVELSRWKFHFQYATYMYYTAYVRKLGYTPKHMFFIYIFHNCTNVKLLRYIYFWNLSNTILCNINWVWLSFLELIKISMTRHCHFLNFWILKLLNLCNFLIICVNTPKYMREFFIMKK